MEIPDAGIREGVLAAILGGIAWIWRRINGDIKAAKLAAEMVAKSAVKQEDFIRYLEPAETTRKEFRESMKLLFEKQDKHERDDSTLFREIKESLGRLEGQAAQRRQSDH